MASCATDKVGRTRKGSCIGLYDHAEPSSMSEADTVPETDWNDRSDLSSTRSQNSQTPCSSINGLDSLTDADLAQMASHGKGHSRLNEPQRRVVAGRPRRGESERRQSGHKKDLRQPGSPVMDRDLRNQDQNRGTVKAVHILQACPRLEELESPASEPCVATASRFQQSFDSNRGSVRPDSNAHLIRTRGYMETAMNAHAETRRSRNSHSDARHKLLQREFDHDVDFSRRKPPMSREVKANGFKNHSAGLVRNTPRQRSLGFEEGFHDTHAATAAANAAPAHWSTYASSATSSSATTPRSSVRFAPSKLEDVAATARPQAVNTAMHAAGIGVLSVWNRSVALWMQHVEHRGTSIHRPNKLALDCTHFCEPARLFTEMTLDIIKHAGHRPSALAL